MGYCPDSRGGRLRKNDGFSLFLAVFCILPGARGSRQRGSPEFNRMNSFNKRLAAMSNTELKSDITEPKPRTRDRSKR
jgi:hypothetical protein